MIIKPRIPKIEKGIVQNTNKNTMDFYKEIEPTKISNEGLQSTIGDRFDKLRSSASNRLGAAQQDMSNALTRRFAAQGGLGGGAYIKQLQLAGDAAARQKEDVLANIGVQEQAALENEQNRMLQKNMAQADLDFKAKIFSFDRASKMHELDLAERQARIDANTTEFNKRMAEQAGRGGLITKFLGPLL